MKGVINMKAIIYNCLYWKFVWMWFSLRQ